MMALLGMIVLLSLVKFKLQGRYYKKCLRFLLAGLGCEEIDHFMDHLTHENCLKLGLAMRKAWQERIEEAKNEPR